MVDPTDAVSSLGDARRRALYEHVVAHGDWTSRDQAATATGIERANAAHHLDKLAADGLLDVEYRRLTGRSGPGAGRPAKVYRRAARDIAVTLPPRDYELAGRVLAAAIERARVQGLGVEGAIEVEARLVGEELGADIDRRIRHRGARSSAQRTASVLEVLSERGFEPAQDETGTIVLRNCPFHRLAREHTELVCGMNLCLFDEAMRLVARAGLSAVLEPEEGQCCVKLHRRS